jgi:two-component system NtrC family response regulator
MYTVLVVDDQKNYLVVLEDLLRAEGYEVVTKSSGAQALDLCRTVDVDLMITDMRMPGMDGIKLLSEVKRIDSDLPIIMMTAYATVEKAVEAMKRGAHDYIMKPFRNDELLVQIQQAIQVGELRRGQRRMHTEHSSKRPLVCESPEMTDILRQIDQVAQTNSTVLISGESGTGKEYLARAIHDASAQKARPFVAVNCAAIPEGLLESELFGHQRGAFTGAVAMRKGVFERADGGTLFLDEVGEMSPALQVKLLRILEERSFERVGGTQTIRVDVRIVAATNKDLRRLVEAEKFREDLFYRLFVFHIQVPALRERRKDILPLAEHFVRLYAFEIGKDLAGLSREAGEALLAYDWPGNVRELQNAIERAVVLVRERTIELGDLPADTVRGRRQHGDESELSLPEGSTLPKTLDDLERRLIQRALKESGGVQAKAARALGISRSNFQYRMTRLGLREAGERAHPIPTESKKTFPS